MSATHSKLCLVSRCSTQPTPEINLSPNFMYITDALDELESWLWHHYPDTFLRSYQPGLTDEEIDVIFNKIFLVPSLEIREM
jgi:hypothetical protein